MAAPLSRPRRSAAGTPAAAIQPAEAGGHPAPAAALARLEDAAPAAVLSPLSDAAVASRPRAPRDERPVIHVTIDRLEVRAPATPKAAVERRKSRPLPSQSLADYLRGGAGGGRR
jgi:hypothetical protein